MTEVDVNPSGDSARRFVLALFLRHPTLSVAEIEAALGYSGTHSHEVGAPRLTPAGRMLPGRHKDTRWRYSMDFTVHEQHFVERISEFADEIGGRAEFFAEVRATGGEACLIVSFLGDGHFGDELSPTLLARLAALNLGLGIEVYDTVQS